MHLHKLMGRWVTSLLNPMFATFTILICASSKDQTDRIPTRRMTMRMFDVQGIEILAPRHTVFEVVKQPANRPQWAHTFVSATDDRARLETPRGALDVGLQV